MNSITLTADERAALQEAGDDARHGVAFTTAAANRLRAIVDRFDFDTIVPNDRIDPAWNTGGLRG